MPSTTVPKSYCLEVELYDDDVQHYFATVRVSRGAGSTPTHRQIRLDSMYEQVQQIVDNHLRQLCNQLSLSMREQRKNAKDNT